MDVLGREGVLRTIANVFDLGVGQPPLRVEEHVEGDLTLFVDRFDRLELLLAGQDVVVGILHDDIDTIQLGNRIGRLVHDLELLVAQNGPFSRQHQLGVAHAGMGATEADWH